MTPIEYHILPPVKKAVGKCAAGARYVLWGAALLALAELLLLPLRMPLAGIICGMAAQMLLGLGLAFLCVLAAWGHSVLLAGQGLVATRWLLWLGALLAPLLPVCWCCTLLTGKLLLYRQAELPFILGIILVAGAVCNLPRMAAAPWHLQVRVVAVPLLVVAAYCCDTPGTLVLSAIFKLMAAWAASAPLLQLAYLAPRIISMPERN